MLTGIHFLTTLACNFECDHCFLWCGPGSRGTFTADQIRAVLDEAVRLGGIEMVYFEGGEPFLYYPLVLEGIRLARERGFASGIVTNAYWATSAEDAALWLRPLVDLGVTSISLSDDSLHYGDQRGAHAERATAAAAKLGMAAKVLCTERPTVQPRAADAPGAGPPAIAGGVMFRGRAAEKLVDGLPRRPWRDMVRCPHEDLKDPRRVHVDSYGHVHLCQGLCMGNLWKVPLSQLARAYDGPSHPIAGPLLRGGPAQLAREYAVPPEEAYVDECHFCYKVRLALIDRFPEHLGPRQVYGLT
jgi:hypothetical protein